MAIRLIYETHATTTDNEAGIATGWLPGELSVRGRQEATRLGERRRDGGLAAVYVSDLRRAVETAASAFAGSGIPVVQDARLRECNYGDSNGTPVTELARLRRWHIDEPFPGGQSYREVAEAMRWFLRDLAASRDGQAILVIAHSANRWALDHLLRGVALEDLVDAPFAWQEGWEYALPAGYGS